MKKGPHNKDPLRCPVPTATSQAHILCPCLSFHLSWHLSPVCLP